jgi:tRNA (cytidine/uridine-2'-O-)-methyltransferase
MFNVVLVAPQIPQNTGNIGRLCVCTDTVLHLVRPLGFSLDEKYIRRSGMDYWNHLELNVYDSFDELLEVMSDSDFYFFSTKTERTYLECPYKKGDFLIFGNEGAGLPQYMYKKYPEKLYTIPMPGKYGRSLNLANSVAIVLYQALQT